ncbi:beta-glucan synthesis-associated [Trametes gibbosa]|nr:beta-glucan synthesis-associated [Trametes gibbosa]
MGAMMSTWNKFCFTGGFVEASVMLPGFNNVEDLWPAAWAMGNLGRAGYGASLDRMMSCWPYTYDACDVGTAPNQTIQGLPICTTIDEDAGQDGVLSFLPGRRLSRCTCPSESHPGPVHENGESAVPVLLARLELYHNPDSGDLPTMLTSGTTPSTTCSSKILGQLNSYMGGVYQQATSVVTQTNQRAYDSEYSGAGYSVYGFQYKPGFWDAYSSWIVDGQFSWTLRQLGMAADRNVYYGPTPLALCDSAGRYSSSNPSWALVETC